MTESTEKETTKRTGKTGKVSYTERAGTQLDHRFCTKVLSRGKQVGLIDRSKNVFQCGGESTNFIFWKLKSITLGLDAWSTILEHAYDVDQLEFVDNDKNRVFVCDLETAINDGTEYDAGIGKRWAIPLGKFKCYDATGQPWVGQQWKGAEK